MVSLTETQRCDAAEQHLYPAHYRQCLSNCSMSHDCIPPYPSMYALFQVQFQVNSKYYLDDEHKHQERSERSVNVMSELATTMGMTEEVADY